MTLGSSDQISRRMLSTSESGDRPVLTSNAFASEPYHRQRVRYIRLRRHWFPNPLVAHIGNHADDLERGIIRRAQHALQLESRLLAHRIRAAQEGLDERLIHHQHLARRRQIFGRKSAAAFDRAAHGLEMALAARRQ